MQTIITEQTGAQWLAIKTGQQGARAVWVQQALGSPASTAKPGVVGFYAPSINAAADQLAN